MEYIKEQLSFEFIRFPKQIFSQAYEALSLPAKILYSLMLDRTSLSVKNGWIEEGKAYICFAITEIQKILSVSKSAAMKYVKELIDMDLISKKKRGQGMADRIYVKAIEGMNKPEPKKMEEPAKEEKKEDKPKQESKPSRSSVKMEDIKKQISYEKLMGNKYVDEIVEVMASALGSDCEYIILSGQKLDMKTVKSRLSALTHSDIENVTKTLNNRYTQVFNARKYILTLLLNAKSVLSTLKIQKPKPVNRFNDFEQREVKDWDALERRLLSRSLF